MGLANSMYHGREKRQSNHVLVDHESMNPARIKCLLRAC